jgi:hypothetical protein
LPVSGMGVEGMGEAPWGGSGQRSAVSGQQSVVGGQWSAAFDKLLGRVGDQNAGVARGHLSKVVSCQQSAVSGQ